MQKKIDKSILLFLILQPFLDVLTSIGIHNNWKGSIGLLIRGAFFIFVLFYLVIKKKEKKGVFALIFYLIIEMFYFYSSTTNALVSEAFNLIKLFYLPFLLLFFNHYENKSINEKLMTMLYFIYMNLIIIPYIFNIGFDIVYENKEGYLGLFYGGNELSALFIGLLPIVLNFILAQKNLFLKLFFFLEIVMVMVLVGTKTLFLGIGLVFTLFILKGLKKNVQSFSKKRKSLMILAIGLFLLTSSLLIPKTPVYKNFKVTLNYYQIHSMKDFVSIDTIDKVIFSTRLSFLKNVHSYYKEREVKEKLFGIGITKINKIKDIEIDVLDIFYSIGIIGFLIWFLFMILSIRKSKLEGIYQLSLFLFLFISLFSGHILNKPMVSTFISLLPLLNKNKKEE
ncbi:MAG: hypothetical protein HFJ02_03720 [Bacilli bacterium]|nr:hypothetical protein [Bacilli bacterium]